MRKGSRGCDVWDDLVTVEMKQGVVGRRWLEQARRQEGQPQKAFSSMGRTLTA